MKFGRGSCGVAGGLRGDGSGRVFRVRLLGSVFFFFIFGLCGSLWPDLEW